MKEEKQTFRDQARTHRAQLTVNPMDFESVIEVFLKEIKPQKQQKIALYWPVGTEFDGRFLLDELSGRGFECLLPKVSDGTRVLSFVARSDDCRMAESAFGVLVPQNGEVKSPDIVLAPLLAFDRKGVRLGQGGGYYDATIEALRADGDILYAGLCYGEQAVLFNLPKEGHDQLLDCVVTPQGVTWF